MVCCFPVFYNKYQRRNRKDVEDVVDGSFDRFRKFPKLGVALAYIALKPNAAAMKSTYADIFGQYITEIIVPHMSKTPAASLVTSGTHFLNIMYDLYLPLFQMARAHC